MDSNKKKNQQLKRAHRRLRQRVKGTPERLRLCVTRSLRHISAQIIDDTAGKTLAAASSKKKDFGQAGGNVAAAKAVGAAIAAAAVEKNIKAVVFDRGGRQFHGRVKALADAAREGGLQF